MFKRILGLSALTVLLFTSCNSNGCYETTEVKVNCSFFSTDTQKAVGLDSVTVWGVGSDSIIYKNEKLTELALELNPKARKTQYVVLIKAMGGNYYYKDTISLYHTNQPWFQSMDCGCLVFSTLDSCKTTGSIFRTTTLKNSKIINKKAENVILNL